MKTSVKRNKGNKSMRATAWWLVAAGLCGAACSGQTGATVSTVDAGPTSACPGGGVLISEPGRNPQMVCNGAFGSLVNTLPLALGDAHCPNGGYQVQSGLDNGAGGGTANDGVLEPGEVTSTEYVCNGSLGSAVPGSLTPPAGSPGSFVIRANGGAGSANIGGNGGNVWIGMDAGSNGGNVKLFNTGSFDAGFEVPAAPAGDFGTTPAQLTSTLEIPNQVPVGPATCTTLTPVPANGSYFTCGGNLYVVQSVTITQVTGINIGQGATVTFDLPSSESLNVTVSGSVHNAGTIAVKLFTPGDAALFAVSGQDYYGSAASSLVVTNQAQGSATAAGNPGSSLTIFGGFLGSVVNLGQIQAQGGDGNPGGTGGAIRLFAGQRVINAGNLVAHGGAGLGTSVTSIGGNAVGAVTLNSVNLGGVLNSGSIDVSGGSGFAGGGAGGIAQVFTGSSTIVGAAGDLVSTGPVVASGGNVSSSCTGPCAAGQGGAVWLQSYNGKLWVTGALSAAGGASPNGTGNKGGNVKVSASSKSANVPMGDLVFAASVDASGGAGLGGGSGGNVSIEVPQNYLPQGQELVLYGISEVHAEAGDGVTHGGNGGTFYLINKYAVATSSGGGGSVANYANVFASGGRGLGTGAVGGLQGYVTLYTNDYANTFAGATQELAINAGNIFASGGDGAAGGGGSSFNCIELYGMTGVTNTGMLTCQGGSAVQAGTGGHGGRIWVTADLGLTRNTGAVDSSGGAGAGGAANGGNAGQIYFLGGTLGVSLDAAATANGGAGGMTSGQGGSGGTIEAFGQGATLTSLGSAANFSVKGGAGAKVGASGDVLIDGQYVTSAWSH
jgi:hypothetical protein